jgi:hypothetical protein
MTAGRYCREEQSHRSMRVPAQRQPVHNQRSFLPGAYFRRLPMPMQPRVIVTNAEKCAQVRRLGSCGRRRCSSRGRRPREHRDVLYGEEVDECPRTPGRPTTNRTYRQAEVYELRHHKRQKYGRLGAFPLLITQNAVVIVATDRLSKGRTRRSARNFEVIGVHDLG